MFHFSIQHDREELREFLRAARERFNTHGENLKETYANLGTNLQAISETLGGTAIELCSENPNNPVANHMFEGISKIQDTIWKTTAEICNATNRLTEMQANGRRANE